MLADVIDMEWYDNNNNDPIKIENSWNMEYPTNNFVSNIPRKSTAWVISL